MNKLNSVHLMTGGKIMKKNKYKKEILTIEGISKPIITYEFKYYDDLLSKIIKELKKSK